MKLTARSLAFFDLYRARHSDYRSAADTARDVVNEIIENAGIDLHLVSSRAKEPASVLAKIRRNRYTDPIRDLTDRIGVRVIAYYEDDVERVVNAVKASRLLKIYTTQSIDKRKALGLHEFGYRSVHLIVRLKKSAFGTSKHALLSEAPFEIQIRSLLEHTWAEIEHQVVYKSGVKYPDATKRRFSAVAGVLEVLDREFQTLRDERRRLEIGYGERYANGLDRNVRFDSARLVGFLNYLRPQASAAGLAAHLQLTCIELLHAVGIDNARGLERVLAKPQVRNTVEEYAAANGITAAEVSFFALLVLCAVGTNVIVVGEQFRECLQDDNLNAIAARLTVRAQRRNTTRARRRPNKR